MNKEIEELYDCQKKLLDEQEILLKSFKIDEFLQKTDEFIKLCGKIIEIKQGGRNGK